MIKSDKWILEQCSQKQMISPFLAQSVKEIKLGDKPIPALSYGVGSFSYDLRLGYQLKIFQRVPGQVVDPKNFDQNCLVDAPLLEDQNGQYFIIPANSYALGLTIETIKMPRNTLGVIVGKSTMARVGVILNCTPIEPEFSGTVVLEFSNSCSADVRLYAGEGCGAILFFESTEECAISYADKGGKYMHQGAEITMAKV